MAAAAILKMEKWPYLSCGLSDLDENWHDEISKILDGGGRHLEKSKNRHISAAVRPILTKFGKMMYFERLDCPDR